MVKMVVVGVGRIGSNGVEWGGRRDRRPSSGGGVFGKRN